MICPECGQEIPDTEVLDEFMDDDALFELFGKVRDQLDRLTIRREG